MTDNADNNTDTDEQLASFEASRFSDAADLLAEARNSVAGYHTARWHAATTDSERDQWTQAGTDLSAEFGAAVDSGSL